MIIQKQRSGKITEETSRNFLQVIRDWLAQAVQAIRNMGLLLDNTGLGDSRFGQYVKEIREEVDKVLPRDGSLDPAPIAPKRSQVGGIKNIGHQYETTSMRETVTRVRENVFDSTKEISEEQTATAWDYIQGLTDFIDRRANQIAESINQKSGTELGSAMMQVELLRYAVKLSAQNSDRKMLNYLLASINLMPGGLYAEGTSNNAKQLRTRAEFESPSLTAQKGYISQSDEITSKMLADRSNNKDDNDFIRSLREDLQQMKLDSIDVIEEIGDIEQGRGIGIMKNLENKGITTH